jgi:glutamate-1-semialdehyde 2,1-aminomutase
MTTIAIVQARLGSTRFPNKVMRLIGGIPMIELLIRRLRNAKKLDRIVLATSTDTKNLPMVEYMRQAGVEVYQGSEDDVLDRYYQAALVNGADTVVRITGDCPLVDAALVDQMIAEYEHLGVEYISNRYPPTFPDGLDIDVFSFESLAKTWREAVKQYDREHVTPFFYDSGLFEVSNLEHSEDLSLERWTVDEPEDFTVISDVFRYFSPKIDFSWLDVMELRQRQPDIFAANRHLIRNEGGTLGTGQKLWRRAKRIIPGGSMLLSKRSEMFLPDQWPAYFSKAKGCRVWDLDGRELIDMSIMGIGTNTLGYGNTEVDNVVIETVKSGNMSTLNCPDEVYLAERLVDIHPWADMVRLCRSGGEANAVAIRIARAASGKDKVAICGYHGWHDWYLSANLSDDKSLDGHLLPGLEPNGVPRSLKATVFPFRYNEFSELEALVNAQDIGTIKMEVVRNCEPKEGFLHKVRKLASDKGIVLIFDECTSGFRQTFGGLHKLYGVEPDIAMFGKALGNGYAITAVVGRRSVMEAAQSTFISSTFWTERIGPAAALKTLEVMEKMRSWELITSTGLKMRDGWQLLADRHQLKIEHWGLPALAGFTICSHNALAYKTLITQEMLRKGYLAGNSFYACTEHSEEIVNEYLTALDSVFAIIRECEDGRDVLSLLKGPICHSGFKRLN